ncbi:MAG: MCP four helix bundle domain-containing protein, partial [Rubrimonas sp.]
MTIKAKLAAAFAAVLLMMGGIVWLSIANLSAANERAEELVNVMTQRVQLANRLREEVVVTGRALRNVLLDNDPDGKRAHMADVQASRARIVDLAASLEQVASAEGRNMLSEFVANQRRYDEYANRIFELSLRNTNVAAGDKSIEEANPALDRFLEAVDVAARALAANPSVDREQIAVLTARMESSVRRAAMDEKNVVIAIDEDVMRDFSQRSLAGIETARAALDQMDVISNGAARAERAEARQRLDAYAELSRQTKALALENSNTLAFRTLQNDAFPIAQANARVIDAIVKLNQDRMQEAISESEAAYAFSRTLLIGGAAIALLIGTIAATWISISVSRGLARAVAVARGVEKGDLSLDAKPSTRDEIGDLLGAMDRMNASMRDITGVAEKISQGDLTVTTRRRSEVDSLGIALETMLAKLREVISNANLSANGVAEGAQAMSATAEQLSQGSTEQAAAAEQASSSMEQMSANIRQSADNAAQTEKIATQAAKEAADSGKAVEEAVRAMKTIAEKINIIQEIARQTDLLALNAAVEAARAGQ